PARAPLLRHARGVRAAGGVQARPAVDLADREDLDVREVEALEQRGEASTEDEDPGVGVVEDRAQLVRGQVGVERDQVQPALVARERRLDQRVAVVGHDRHRAPRACAERPEEVHELVRPAGELAVGERPVRPCEHRGRIGVVLREPPEAESAVPRVGRPRWGHQKIVTEFTAATRVRAWTTSTSTARGCGRSSTPATSCSTPWRTTGERTSSPAPPTASRPSSTTRSPSSGSSPPPAWPLPTCRSSTAGSASPGRTCGPWRTNCGATT